MKKKKKKHTLNYNEVYCTPGRQYCIFVAVVFTICTFNGAWLLHSNALVIQMAIDKCQAGKQARKASLTKVLTNLKLQLVMKYSHRFSMNTVVCKKVQKISFLDLKWQFSGGQE